jgi:RNA polymerase sigma-70 factor (sigma-E family)
MGELMSDAERDEDVVVFAVDDPADLYRREYNSMLRLAVAMVDSKAIAEDLVQNAFADVWLRWKRLQNPEAYLRVCVVNHCRRELRRRQLLRRPVAVEERAIGPEARLLLDAVRALSPRRRAVVVLRYYEDMTEAQIAECLGIKEGTVRATLHQALAQLRGVIER